MCLCSLNFLLVVPAAETRGSLLPFVPLVVSLSGLSRNFTQCIIALEETPRIREWLLLHIFAEYSDEWYFAFFDWHEQHLWLYRKPHSGAGHLPSCCYTINGLPTVAGPTLGGFCVGKEPIATGSSSTSQKETERFLGLSNSSAPTHPHSDSIQLYSSLYWTLLI